MIQVVIDPRLRVVIDLGLKDPEEWSRCCGKLRLGGGKVVIIDLWFRVVKND